MTNNVHLATPIMDLEKYIHILGHYSWTKSLKFRHNQLSFLTYVLQDKLGQKSKRLQVIYVL
jgi:hypothetical protein